MSAMESLEVLPPNFEFLKTLSGISAGDAKEMIGMYMQSYREYCSVVKIVSRNASSTSGPVSVQRWIRATPSSATSGGTASTRSTPLSAAGLASRVSVSSSVSASPAGQCWRKFLAPSAALGEWPSLERVLSQPVSRLRSDVALGDFSVNRTEPSRLHVLRGGPGPLLSDTLARAAGQKAFPAGTLGAKLAGTSRRGDLPPLPLATTLGGTRLRLQLYNPRDGVRADRGWRRAQVFRLTERAGVLQRVSWGSDDAAVLDLGDDELRRLLEVLVAARWQSSRGEDGIESYLWPSDGARADMTKVVV